MIDQTQDQQQNGQTEEIKLDSKQQQVDKLKKQNSYTYWVDKEKQNNQNVPVKVPKKLDIDTISPISNQSAWNSAGTWEEKKLNIEDVQKQLQETFQPIKTSDNLVEIYKISKITGEFSVVMINGKLKAGYNLNINLKYRGLDNYNEAKGSIKLTDFQDDGDKEIEYSQKNEQFKNECQQSLKKSIEEICSAITQNLKQLGQRI